MIKANNNTIADAAIRIFEKKNDGFLSGDNSLYQAVLMPAEEGSNELVFKLIRKDAAPSVSTPDRMTNEKGEAEYEFLGEKEYLILVSKDGYASKEMAYSTVGNISEKKSIRIPLGKQKCTTLAGVVRNKIKQRGQNPPNAIVKIWNGCSGEETEIFANPNGTFEYCLEPGCDYMVKGMKENYSGEFVKIASAELTGEWIVQRNFVESDRGQ